MSNIYKREGIFYGRVRVRGREFRRSLQTSVKGLAKQRFDKWIADLNHASFYGEARPTWMAAVTRYVAEVLPKSVKPSTGKRYLVSLRQVGPLLESEYLDQIDRKTIARIISARTKVATNATVRRDLTAISQVLSSCIAWDWIDTNAALNFDRRIIRERRDPISPPSREEIDTMLQVCPDMIRRIITVLEETGMRAEECVSLTWPQVDLVSKEILLTKTKGGRPRIVPLSEKAVGTLTGTPRHIASPYVFRHNEWDRYKNFASRFIALRKIANEALKTGKIKGVTVKFRCHDLRHKFAIDTLKNGGDIYKLSRVMGHTSVKTTEIYLNYVGTKTGSCETVSDGLQNAN